MGTPFFKRASDGTIVFSERSSRHPNEKIEDVARTDPSYLRWARRAKTVGLEVALFDAISDAMVKCGVSFTDPRRKGTGKKKS